jgi:hypothetical protein
MNRKILRIYGEILASLKEEDEISWMYGLDYNDPGYRWLLQDHYGTRCKYTSYASRALVFYMRWGKRVRGIDFHKLQKIVLRGAPFTILEWARRFPEANLGKCQRVIVEKGSIKILQEFRKIPGVWAPSIDGVIAMLEVLEK